MRLLNVETMQMEEHFGWRIPSYAILSHCWGDGEVTFQDINGPNWTSMTGAAKIKFACQQCQGQGVRRIWIDTCCIDKTSSAELSEAINSMYSWYQHAVVCLVFLEDVLQEGPVANDKDLQALHAQFAESRWFTRGWTLQELIAPATIGFFDRKWNFLGNKEMLSPLLSRITTIPENVLANPTHRFDCSVARKMSWAAKRQTTRVEDVAYCLLGIFGVHMPLLYGEGTQAFVRLEEEILKESDDQSIFAWGLRDRDETEGLMPLGILADSPAWFLDSEDVVPFPSNPDRQSFAMTNKGLRIELPTWVYRFLSVTGGQEARKQRDIAMQSATSTTTFQAHWVSLSMRRRGATCMFDDPTP